MYEDTDLWPIKCPECHHEFTEQIGRINAGGKITCPGCSLWLTDHHKEFAMALAKARNHEFDPWGNMVRLKKGQ